jgi:hypothetical protein
MSLSPPSDVALELILPTQHRASVSQLWWTSALVVFEAVEASHVPPRLSDRPERSREFIRASCPERNEGARMFATIRRYDGVDQNRTTELTSKVNETLLPKLSKLPGFAGYYLIEAENGVFSSLGLFETAEQGTESSNVVATWIRDEKLETMIPNAPKITSGEVIAQSDGVTRA